MFATIKTFSSRFFASLAWLVLGLLRLVRWLFNALLGSWLPPLWLRKLGQLSQEGGLWLNAHRKQGALGLLLLGLVAIAGAYGWQWYQNLPVPHTVSYSVHAPDLTAYQKQPIVIDTLRVNFAASVAPLAAIGQLVEQGIELQPAVAGAWHWASDRSLVFTPAGDWPIDQAYQVTLDQDHLLADGVLLQQYQFATRTQAFKATLANPELYQDPVVPSLKKLVATINFSHPVDTDTLQQWVAINLDRGLEYRDKDVAPTPEISFSKDLLAAYIHSAPLATPLESTAVKLVIAPGTKPRDGGNVIGTPLQTAVTVPGRYRLTFASPNIQFVDNTRGEPEPVLMFSSSSAVSDEAIAPKVQAWLLPAQNPEGGKHWSASAIDEKLLAKAERLPLSHIPSVEPLNSLHAFKFKAEPGRYIYMRVAANIEAVGGYLAKTPTTSLLAMPKYPRALSFMSEGALLSLNGEKNLGFVARGVPGAHVEIARLLPNQLHHLVDQNDGSFARPDFSNGYFDRLVERMSFDVPLGNGDPAKTHYNHLDLAPYLSAEGGRRGIFVIKLSPQDQPSTSTFNSYYDDEEDAPSDLRFIVVTDLGIIAKRSSDGSHDLFVQSLSNGGAIAGAQVQIIGRNGLPVASGSTDASGQAHFAKLDELRREKTPLLYVVTQGNDQSFLPVAQSQHRLDFSRFDIGGQYEAGVADRLNAYLFSDRGLYRPGETAHLGMIVRSGNWLGQLQGLPVELLVHDPRGQTVLQQRIKLSASGFETLDFVSSQAAPAGTYSATLQLIGEQERRTDLGSVNFKVRDFEPDRMKVSASLSSQPVTGWLAPTAVHAKVKALHLFGAPASNRRVTADMILAPAYAAFEGYSDYRFRISNSLSENSTEELPETVTDDNGEATLELKLERYAASTYRLNLLARVFEAEGGRNVAAQSSLMVSSAPWLIGVKSQDALSYISKGAKREVQWLAINPELQPQAVDGLTLELVEHRYMSVLVKQPDGTYKYQSRVKHLPLGSQPLALAANGASSRLNTDEPGDFTLTVKDAAGNALNQVDYSVAGQGNASRSLERNAELQLRLDQDSYAPEGEVAISIRAPYTGAGLITIERDKVYVHQWFKTDSTSSVQHIRLPQGLEGNAYVNVQFVRDSGSPEVYMSPLSYAVAPLRINLDARRIPLKVSAAEQIEPGQTLAMTVTSDRPGRAVVWAVNEGILQVARYQTPDPLALFFQKRALEVDTSQILDLLLPEFSRLMSAAPGGDGEDLLGAHLNPFKRKHRPPVAWWSGLVDLPAGESTFNYPVPDSFNGKLRVFAVAVDDSRIGVSEAATEVRGPLVLTPNVPAFVAPGDVFKVSVGVFSNLAQSTKIKFELHTSAGLKVAAISSQSLELAPRKEGVIEISLQALETLGSADMTFVAILPDGKRVQIGETTSIRPLVERRVALSLGRFTDSSQTVPVQRDLYPELRSVHLSAGASPLVWADGLQSYLADYSYVCTEQLVSKAMPTLILGSTAEGLAPATQAAFDSAISILRQRQNLTGGFGLWQASPDAAPFASLYASDFLLEAKERNYPVPGDLLNRANAYLSQVANGPSEGLSELRNRAYAAYLLTRQGVVTSGALADIRERYETYQGKHWQRDLGAAYLAASYKLLKQHKQAEQLFAQQVWLSSEREWRSDGLYYDTLTHDAEHLHLLSKHFPQLLDDVPLELLDNLGKRLNQQHYNSLSAALLLRAFDGYGAQAEAEQNLSVSAWSKQQTEQVLTLLGKPPRTAVPLATKKLLLSKDGSTPAFYMLSEAGYDRGAPDKEISNGLEVQREYLDLDGKPLSQVKVGDEFLVRLRLRAKQHDEIQQVAVVDLLPGGVEPVYNLPVAAEDSNDSESSDEECSEECDSSDEDSGETEEEVPTWQPPVGDAKLSDWTPEFADVRDDRVVLYGTVLRDVGTFVYRVRATNAGTFGTPPAYAEGMYDSTLQARGKSGKLEIVKP